MRSDHHRVALPMSEEWVATKSTALSRSICWSSILAACRLSPPMLYQVFAEQEYSGRRSTLLPRFARDIFGQRALASMSAPWYQPHHTSTSIGNVAAAISVSGEELMTLCGRRSEGRSACKIRLGTAC